MPNYVFINGQMYNSDVLAHHGIKGMKWGRRRYQNTDGSLTPAGIKRYAKKGYAEDSYNSNKTRAGKVYDKVTNAHKYGGDMMYNMSSKAENKARAEKYLKDKAAKTDAKTKRKALEKEYGELEDKMTYGKKTDTKKNAALEKRMSDVRTEMNKTSKSNKVKADDSFSEAMRKTAKSAGTGHRVGNFMLNGPFGGTAYTAARTAGYSRGGAEAVSIVSSLLGGPVGNAVAVGLMRSEYYDKNR